MLRKKVRVVKNHTKAWAQKNEWQKTLRRKVRVVKNHQTDPQSIHRIFSVFLTNAGIIYLTKFNFYIIFDIGISNILT